MRKYWIGAAIGLLFLNVICGAWNAARAASTDAVSVGAGVRFICQTSAPSPIGRARLWARCSDGALVYTSAANVDYTVKP